MISRDDFKTALGPLIAIYGNPDGGDAQYWNVYYGTLAHLSPDTLNEAVVLVLQTYVYNIFPKPSVLVDAVQQLAGKAGRTGMEAWGDVQRAIAEHGYHKPPEGYAGGADGAVDLPSYRWAFADPLVLEVVSNMGWRYLCFSEAPGVDQAHFAKAYDALRERTARSEALALPEPADGTRRLTSGTELVARLAKEMRK